MQRIGFRIGAALIGAAAMAFAGVAPAGATDGNGAARVEVPGAGVLGGAGVPGRTASHGFTGEFGEYTPVTPTRVLDTRNGGGPIGPGQNRLLDVDAATDQVPASQVIAVVLNVTAVSPTENGFLTVYPADDPQPTVSNVNFVRGQTVANLATVPADGGRVRFYNLTGNTHVVADVVGYYADTAGTAGSRFVGAAPARLLDTRDGTGRGGSTAPVGAQSSIPLTIAPPSGTTRAVVLNVTAVSPTATSYVTAYPGNLGTPPTASNINLVPGDVRPNLVIVRMPAGVNTVRFYNHNGSTHLIADLLGYYDESQTGDTGRFIPAVPTRWYDSRAPKDAQGNPLPPEPIDPSFIAVFPFRAPGASSTDIGAVAANLTATGPAGAGFLTMYPSAPQRLNVSNVNFRPGETVPNHVLVRTSRINDPAYLDSIDLASPVTATHVVFDIFGYFHK